MIQASTVALRRADKWNERRGGRLQTPVCLQRGEGCWEKPPVLNWSFAASAEANPEEQRVGC